MVLEQRLANVNLVLLLLDLEEVDWRFAHATMDVPQHALDIIMLLDDAGLELVFEAIVAEVVVERLVVGSDLPDLAAHASDHRDAVGLFLPRALEAQSSFSVAIPNVEILVFRDSVDGEVHFVELGHKAPLGSAKTLVKSIVQDVISPLWGLAIP